MLTKPNPRYKVLPALASVYGDAAYLAAWRGWDEDEQYRHLSAIERWNEALRGGYVEDEMALTHPYNYLTEQEVENVT